MISYKPFWKTLEQSPESTYTLINKYHISGSTIDRLRHDRPLNTTSLNDLCRILNCRLEQIAQYEDSDLDQTL